MSKKIVLSSEMVVYDDMSELPPSEQELVEAAKASALHAYAPYSGFSVGAAVRLDDGTIVTGNNQENAAYPSGLCAERVALFYASAKFPASKISAIAVTAKSSAAGPVSPCGSCRQVMAEYEMRQEKPFKIIMTGEADRVFCCDSVLSLLPLAFGKNNLPI